MNIAGKAGQSRPRPGLTGRTCPAQNGVGGEAHPCNAINTLPRLQERRDGLAPGLAAEEAVLPLPSTACRCPSFDRHPVGGPVENGGKQHMRLLASMPERRAASVSQVPLLSGGM